MAKKNWITDATASGKGNLHRNLGIPQGQRIPASKLEPKSSDSTTVKREKTLAKTLGKMRGGR